MTGGTYDFSDRFYARSWQIHYARRGMALVHAGQRKDAQTHLDQAIHWEHEVQRIESALHGQKRAHLQTEPAPSARTSARVRRRP